MSPDAAPTFNLAEILLNQVFLVEQPALSIFTLLMPMMMTRQSKKTRWGVDTPNDLKMDILLTSKIFASNKKATSPQRVGLLNTQLTMTLCKPLKRFSTWPRNAHISAAWRQNIINNFIRMELWLVASKFKQNQVQKHDPLSTQSVCNLETPIQHNNAIVLRDPNAFQYIKSQFTQIVLNLLDYPLTPEMRTH